jgi:hypothetical protein
MKTTDIQNEEDNFARIIRSKLADYAPSIEDGSWEKLEKRLNASARKTLLVWPWISGISAAASIALAIVFLSPNKELRPNESTKHLSDHAERITESLLAEENVSSTRIPSVQIETKQRSGNNKASNQAPAFCESDVIATEEITIQPSTESSVNEEINPEENPEIRRNSPAEIWQEEPISSQKFRKKSGSLAFHTSLGGGLSVSNKAMNTISSDYFSKPQLIRQLAMYASSALNTTILDPNAFEHISHHPPISVGLSIAKPIDDYFSIESGLTYSFLYSRFRNEIPWCEASRSLHYVGIPVNLAVKLLPPRSHSPWNLYFSTGGMVEKCVWEHSVQKESNSSEMPRIINNGKIDGLMWSLQAALGVAYKFNGDYSLFFEPKVSYYFESGQPFSIRTEHPFVPSLTIGLRHIFDN